MNKYYSPRIDRDLVRVLYELKTALHVPMTKLASACIRRGLEEQRALTGIKPQCALRPVARAKARSSTKRP